MDNTKVHELFSKFPKVSLGFYPTPLHKLETLSQETGVNLYIKREDFSGVSLFGGNKIRKLEYILGAAKERDMMKPTIVTGGLNLAKK